MKGISKYILLMSIILSTTSCVPRQTLLSKKVQEPVDLNWYVNYSWFTTKWGSDRVSQSITEKTGVTIDFMTPIGKESNKLGTLISSNNLPDLITLGWWEPQLGQLIESGQVYALDVLDEQYGGGFLEVANERVCEWYTQEDGHLYGYPSSFFLLEDYKNNENIGSNQTFLVRKDIYERLGKPDMTTPEGFMEAVRQAAKLYPSVDGSPLIPIGAHQFQEEGCVSFDQYLQNFLAVPYEKDGKYYDRYTDEEYIRWLKVFRQLKEEGYLKDEIFTDQRIQMQEKLAKGQYFCMLYQRTDMEQQQLSLYQTQPDKIYIAIDGPKNSQKDDHILPGNGMAGWTVTLISKDCKNPRKALELMTYMMSEEGQLLLAMGIEGETYEWQGDKPVFKPAIQELLYRDRKSFNKQYGAYYTYWMLQNESMFLKWKQPAQEPLRQLEEWTIPYTHYLEQYTLTFEDDPDMNKINERINKLWGNTLIDLLLAESEESFDACLQAFVRTRDEIGYPLLVEASTKKIEQAKQKLGIK